MPVIVQIIIFTLLGATILFILYAIIKSTSGSKKIDNLKKFIKAGKYPQAQKLGKQIIAKNAKDYVAHYYLGKAYISDNKTELGYMEYILVNENAIFNGDIPELSFRKDMAMLHKKFNHPEEALKEYLLLTKLEPANSDNYYNIGKIYEDKSRTEQALKFYQKAVATNRKHIKAHASLGYMLFRSKQYTEAKKEIDTAIALSPNTYSNYYYLGKILKENQDYNGALNAFEKAERDSEFRQKSLIERGACYMAGNSYDNAVIELETAVKANKNESSDDTLYARYFLAQCYEKMRLLDKAIYQWEQITAVTANFRDVAEKLNQYKGLQANDNMKEYLTCSAERFGEICKKIVMNSMKLYITNFQITKFGCMFLATEGKNENWGVRAATYLIQFYRESEPITDTVVRKVVDVVQKQGYTKAYICSSGGFTRTAASFTEARPVELYDKASLEGFLEKAEI